MLFLLVLILRSGVGGLKMSKNNADDFRVLYDGRQEYYKTIGLVLRELMIVSVRGDYRAWNRCLRGLLSLTKRYVTQNRVAIEKLLSEAAATLRDAQTNNRKDGMLQHTRTSLFASVEEQLWEAQDLLTEELTEKGVLVPEGVEGPAVKAIYS